jgi:hypothetical protein
MNILNDKIKEEFYIRLYFGVVTDFYFAGVKRAYLDFNRTLHLKQETKIQREIIRIENEHYLVNSLKELIKKEIRNQKEFDKEHKTIVLNLKKNWDKLTIGQAQKWVNMTLKYWLLFGNNRIQSIEKNVAYFHIPIDSIIQEFMLPNVKYKAWSKMSDYDLEYMEYQKKFRNISKETPIVAEFKIFNKMNK